MDLLLSFYHTDNTLVFALEIFATIVSLLAGGRFLGPYLPLIGRFVEAAEPTLSRLEQTFPALKKSWLFKATMTIAEFYALLDKLVLAAEKDKVNDPTGELRRKKVREALMRIFKIAEGKWTPDQEALVEDLIEGSVANLGLMEKVMAGQTAPFRPSGDSPAPGNRPS